MSNELYNSGEKEEFLKTINSEDIRTLYRHVFSKSKGAEQLYQKDLYLFTLKQLEDVFRNANPATLNSAVNIKSRLNSYLTWAIKNGRRSSNINPIQGLPNDWVKQFIDKSFQRHLSEAEIFDLVEGLYNAQDQALVQCIFEGIMGQEFSEIRSINYKNIDWLNNIIKVYDKKTESYREVKVSNRCMRYIENAYNQENYISEDTELSKPLVNFQDNVFKNTQWRSSKYLDVSHTNLMKRLYSIKEKYELNDFTRIRDRKSVV